jgi:cell division protein FtsB
MSSKNQNPYGDAYQGAREDLSIWKRRALEAEAKVRDQDQIIDRLTVELNSGNGPVRMGEPYIAVPVVERQPVAFIQIPKNVEKYGHGDEPDRLKFGKPGQFFAGGKSPMFDFILLYTAPPELAELQAKLESLGEDIGQSRSELEDAESDIETLTDHNIELQATIANLNERHELGVSARDGMRKEISLLRSEKTELRAEIERLKGGQGEPVYQVCDGVNGWRDVERLKFTACQLDPEEYECRVLFNSQPAPVSVVLSQDIRKQYEIWADANGYDIARNEHGDYAGLVEDSMWSGWQAKAEHWALPERIARGQSIEQDVKAIGWNACLDKVKELNS